MKIQRLGMIGILLFCLTALTGCSVIENVLTSQQSQQERSNGIFTELNSVIREGNLNEVKRLLDEGSSPNTAADYGHGVESIPVGNPSRAINFNEEPLPMVRTLLEAEANPAEDFPAVNDAVESGNLEIVELMLQYGTNANDGLQSAVKYNNVDIVRLMLNYGADPNNGVTLARVNQNTEMLQLLEGAEDTIERRPRQRFIQRIKRQRTA